MKADTVLMPNGIRRVFSYSLYRDAEMAIESRGGALGHPTSEESPCRSRLKRKKIETERSNKNFCLCSGNSSLSEQNKGKKKLTFPKEKHTPKRENDLLSQKLVDNR